MKKLTLVQRGCDIFIKTYIKIILLLMVLMSVLLIGCAGLQQITLDRLSNKADVFVGKSADRLLKVNGQPDVSSQLTSGESLWTYKANRKGQRIWRKITSGSCIRCHNPEYMVWINTNFIIGLDGLVKSYTVVEE
ncbi:MAG: hypothetical protein C0407_01595 [Desulfobacca sp.]|nr:hypothetical protein [Desulfobacca sp.]